jgi:serine O-acetyltransferase
MKYNGNTVKAWVGESQWRAIRADFARFRKQGLSGWASEGFWAILIYRLQRIVRSYRPRWVWRPALWVLHIVRKLFTTVTHIDIHPSAEIGPGLFIPHVGSIRVHAATKIGADCLIFHGCTIGAQTGGAVISDHVFISCNSTIIGSVTIGDGASIGANSLVVDNVPAGMTAIGVPARILPGRNFRTKGPPP